MSGGRAFGVNRAYQVLCRDVLVSRDASLGPYSGDGIDVPFEAGGTTWTLDVALRRADGAVLLAECRRRQAPVKQEDVGAFAYKVEKLRELLGVPVAGVFFTKAAHQLGAVKVGTWEGIDLAVLAELQQMPGFQLVFQRYDASRAKRLNAYEVHPAPAVLRLSGQC